MHSGLLTQDELMEWLNIHQRSRLEARLRELRIPYVYGREKTLCTTLSAVNDAIIGREYPQDDIEFE